MIRAIFAVLILASYLFAQQAPPVPVVDGELGSCYADFKVTDANGAPVYNASIHVLIRHGFLSKRKLELQVGTNSDGKARVAGSPSEIKRIPVFAVSAGGVTKKIEHDPATNCHAYYDVQLTP